MKMERRLERWREAGLIDAATAGAIADFEERHRRPLALWSVVGLGALSVGLGLIALVAANWHAIGDGVKLGADLLLLAGLAVAAGRLRTAGSEPWADVAVFVYGWATLASIALVGQVYQLDSPLWQPLVFWCAVTGPLFALGRSAWLGMAWGLALGTTWLSLAEPMVDALKDAGLGGLEIVPAFLALGPALALGLALVPALADDAAAGLRRVALGALVVGAVTGPSAWYGSEHLEWTSAGSFALVVAAILAGLPRLWREVPDAVRRAFAEAVGIGAASTCVAFLVPYGDLGWVAALSQLAVLAALARACLVAQASTAFRLCAAAIAVRLVVIYFELFGTLLDTGLALLGGGLLTLLLARQWQRRTRALWAAHAAEPEGGSHA